MFRETIEVYQWLFYSLAIITVLLTFLGGHFNIPICLILGRWLRWFLLSAIFAYLIKTFEVSLRPDWVHFSTGIALWFIVETGYNWIAIKALSFSNLPLFPDFYENKDGDEWPAEKRFIEIKEWLRDKNYTRLKRLNLNSLLDTHLRASIYESSDQLTRIQVIFLPKRKGGAYCMLTQLARAQKVEVALLPTTHTLPYGGYYPEGWEMCRKPLVGSIKRLLLLHHKRVLKLKIEPVVVQDGALEELNEHQRTLERINTETGFFVPRPRREEEGRISQEGRYRLWKEMWLTAYFGKPYT
jgi:hypothetical protein